MNAVICHNGDKDKLFLTKVYLGSQEKITKDFLIQSMAFSSPASSPVASWSSLGRMTSISPKALEAA